MSVIYLFLGTLADSWQASLIGQAPPKLKGKVSLVLMVAIALVKYAIDGPHGGYKSGSLDSCRRTD